MRLRTKMTLASLGLITLMVMSSAPTSGLNAWAVAGAHCHPPGGLGTIWTGDTGYYAYASFGAADVGATVKVDGSRTGGTPGTATNNWAASPFGGYAETWQNGPFPAPAGTTVSAQANALAWGPTGVDPDSDYAAASCI